MLNDEDGPVHKLVRKWQVALPLHPEYGTEPNVFYIPPVLPARLDSNNEFDESAPRVPLEYLQSLFGPAVEPALETLQREMAATRSGGKSELMDTLIAYWWKDMFKPFDQDPGEIEWNRTAASEPQETAG
jgi:ethylbenzene hydroxylase subunit beta/complex iron-sulfur molybdoenzyme family reductase subunit beta